MIFKVKTSVIHGIDALSVDVEVQLSGGQNNFTIIGLGDAAVKEAAVRVRTAIFHSGFFFPKGNVLINLAPAEIKKEGSAFDLPIAVAVLAASGQLNVGKLSEFAVHGELALDGQVKPARGIIAMTVCALETGLKKVIVPAQNQEEASLINSIEVIGVSSLAQLGRYFNQRQQPENNLAKVVPAKIQIKSLVDVWGQENAKRAMTIAAAGGHNLLMIGPPGCGKSMLAERFASILPALSQTEILESVKINSIAGLPIQALLAGCRPFRNPHHIVSDVGLIGGGTVPRPGEISLAHNGVLFLDEFPEYKRSAIEALRAPLESGKVKITRAKASLDLPARFQLIAAMNPCPCGRLGADGKACGCSFQNVRNYLKKLSQPILDRIDLHVELQAVPVSVMNQSAPAAIVDHDYAGQVLQARKRQLERAGKLNAYLEPAEITKIMQLDTSSLKLLETASKRFGFSARTYIRVLKVALTIADLEDSKNLNTKHISEAIGFRCLERLKRYFGEEVEQNAA